MFLNLDSACDSFIDVDPNFIMRHLLAADGCALLSSLNEVIMAMQRVDIPKKFWNTRPMYIAECAFKVLVFTTLGPLGLLSGARLLIFHLNLNCKLVHFFRDPDTIVCVVKNLFVSPIIFQLVIYGCFIVLLYPMMAC